MPPRTAPPLDQVIDQLERQAIDDRERPRLHSRPDEEKQLLRSIADGTADGTTDGEEERRRVVKTKRFAIEPMFEEDAVSRMEELGHSFFVFVNAETERIAVLYRRHDGDYGLIEPSLGEGYTLVGNGRAPPEDVRLTRQGHSERGSNW